MDPYKVLGVTPQTSDDDVKRAYRELARKYHPDNYINNPLADLAEARMKEINEAYDAIMNARTGKGSATGTDNAAGGTGGASQNRGYQGANAGIYTQVRQAINMRNLSLAESLLERVNTRDAEWYYLMGMIFSRKGWYDEAASHIAQACQMDPGNAEYRAAQANLHMNGGYGGYRPMEEASLCNCCVQMAVCNCCLNSCCGGGC